MPPLIIQWIGWELWNNSKLAHDSDFFFSFYSHARNSFSFSFIFFFSFVVSSGTPVLCIVSYVNFELKKKIHYHNNDFRSVSSFRLILERLEVLWFVIVSSRLHVWECKYMKGGRIVQFVFSIKDLITRNPVVVLKLLGF